MREQVKDICIGVLLVIGLILVASIVVSLEREQSTPAQIIKGKGA